MTRRLFLLVPVLLLALGLRLYHVTQVPPSLYYDEVDYGYQARSLLTTGHDYRGELSPFYVHSFNDIRTPIPAYLTVATTFFPLPPELQVRLPFVILGTLTTLLSILLMYTWTRHYYLSLLTGWVFALSPWQLQFSRWSHEVGTVTPYFLIGLILFFRFLSSHRFSSYLSAIFFISLTVYTYRTMSLFAPVTLALLSLLYLKPTLNLGLTRLTGAVLLCGTLVVPFLYFTTLGAPDTPRIQQLSLTADPTVPIWVQRNREVDSSDYLAPTIGKKANPASYLFHNKPLSWVTNLVNNYLHSFSTDFLFLKGDLNLRHSLSQRGPLYLIDLVALFVGLVFLFRHLQFLPFKWLLVWLFVSPLPAALTADGAGHAARLFIFSVPLLVVVSLGWWQIISRLPHLTRPLILALGSLSLIFYLHRYHVHYPLESARWFGYGFKQAITTITPLQAQFDQVLLTATKDPPMIYYLFWSHTPPAQLQQHGPDFSSPHPARPLAKYSVLDWHAGSALQPHTLYLVSPTEIPADLRNPANIPSHINLHQLIKYPDNEVAFYLLSLKSP